MLKPNDKNRKPVTDTHSAIGIQEEVLDLLPGIPALLISLPAPSPVTSFCSFSHHTLISIRSHYDSINCCFQRYILPVNQVI